jgi:hypothetical protein
MTAPRLSDYPDWERKMFVDLHARLLSATKGCRVDMHEPDEQGIKAVVVGTDLDNAMGDRPVILPSGRAEFCVAISRDDGTGTEWFNLASLIALARLAVLR